MGLDMFLYRNGKEVAYWRKANMIHKWFEDHCANGEIEDCGSYPVTKEDLIELKDTCEYVLSHSHLVDGKIQNGMTLEKGEWKPCMVDGKYIEDASYAQELLPTQTGFFFGSNNYDQYYIDDLENTVNQLESVLDKTDFEHDELVYSAWW